MTTNEYYLRIDKFTQSVTGNPPESDVDAEKFDGSMFLHVYLIGNIRSDRSVTLSATLLPPASDDPVAASEAPPQYVEAESLGPNSYKATLQHYMMPDRRALYLLRAFDDGQRPWAITSHQIRTR
jgi:hypothetical protein